MDTVKQLILWGKIFKYTTLPNALLDFHPGGASLSRRTEQRRAFCKLSTKILMATEQTGASERLFFPLKVRHVTIKQYSRLSLWKRPHSRSRSAIFLFTLNHFRTLDRTK